MKHTLLYCQETLRDHVIAAYFFNARGSMLEKTLLGMLRSLLYQLLKHYPLLFERFIPKFKDKQEMHGRKWEWQVGELKNFLLSEMKKSQPKPLLLLVDALDECNEPEVRELVSFLELLSINAVSAKTKLNICLSSRHYPRISMEKKLELVVEGQKEHEHDIFKYVQHNLRAGDERIEQELLRKANNIFMWVILVVKLLNEAFDEGDIRTMRKKLDEVPSGLNKMFSTIINKDNPDNRKRQNTILMFQWVLFAKQLLQPQELYFAVLAGAETEELGAWNRLNDTPEIIKRFITSTSKGLIEVRKGGIIETVQFIHESVNDFLLRKKRLQTLDPTLEQRAVEASHSRLMACCMSYIMIKELEPLPENISYLKEEPAISYPFLRYASTYTLHHAKNAQQTLVQRLHQLHNGFERFRSFHDAFQGSDLRYGTGAKLLYAVSLNGYYEFVQIVLEKGAEVNAQGGFYGNALQAASERGHEEVVALLLENGADVNAQGGHFGNALQAASEGGHEEVVALLVEKGSDVNAQGGYFGNALQAASASRHEAVMALLVEKGVDVNAEGGYFGNALQAASARGYEAAVLLLLENGADVNAEGGMFGNALQAASLGGHKAVVALLLENGAEVNAQGGWFGNALQAASAGGHEAVVLLLLENGADVNAQGGWFINALKAASDGRHKAVVTLLLEKGAQQH
jgi:ankyrin repeat protein